MAVGRSPGYDSGDPPSAIGHLNMTFIPVMCPYCGEMSDLDIEDTGWSRQSYVQDCPVCCQPWQIELTRDADGDWNATVRTGDE